MIRGLIEEDRAKAVALLSQAPEYNIYALGNLNAAGFDEPDLSQFWGDFDETGKLRGIINRYMTGWVIYGHPNSDWPGLADVMDSHAVVAGRLQDNPIGIDSFLPYLRNYTVSQSSVQHFMALSQEEFAPAPPQEDIEVRRATLSDMTALVEFYAGAGHMSRSAKGVSQPIEHTRLWFAEHHGEIFSAALTNAETDDAAMIGGVYTPEKFRNLGYSYSVCSQLCADLLADGKRPILYWETPAAGAVYKRIGFRKMGDWRALRLQRVDE